VTERLYALGDIGATNLRIGLYNDQADKIMGYSAATISDDYEGTIDLVAETLLSKSKNHYEVVAASIAVAAEVSEAGVLVKSGGLTPWVGRNLGADLEAALNLSHGLVGTPNDVVAIALSQQDINRRNDRPVSGIATTLSSGWGGALYYWKPGQTASDEPGHEFLRDGAVCTCGEEGHVEAWVSGRGVEINQNVSMDVWLRASGHAAQFVSDLSQATITMIQRLEGTRRDFIAEEIRWTGGVALGQPFLMQRVAQNIREGLNSPIPVDTVTMGEQAGIHGTFIDAQRRAQEY
jgi:predicted NBD/HSP70 family sugar kinase